MGMLMHHTWQEQQKAEVKAEERKEKAKEAETAVKGEPAETVKRTGGRRKTK